MYTVSMNYITNTRTKSVFMIMMYVLSYVNKSLVTQIIEALNNCLIY